MWISVWIYHGNSVILYFWLWWLLMCIWNHLKMKFQDLVMRWLRGKIIYSRIGDCGILFWLEFILARAPGHRSFPKPLQLELQELFLFDLDSYSPIFGCMDHESLIASHCMCCSTVRLSPAETGSFHWHRWHYQAAFHGLSVFHVCWTCMPCPRKDLFEQDS